MRILEFIFWISLFIIFYTYLGYGILLYLLVKIKECFHRTVIPEQEGWFAGGNTFYCGI